jgi:hypothetical protein
LSRYKDDLITGVWMETYDKESLFWYYYENGKDYTWFDPQYEWDAAVLKRHRLPLKAGYYYEEWLMEPQYIFVAAERKNGPLDSYYDEDLDTMVYWRDSDPGYGNGYQGPGYYWSTQYAYHLSSETPRYETWAEQMSGLSEPSWFTETGAYKDSLTSAGALRASAWPLLFFANLVEKNQDGLNGLLDGILSSVFGAAFEDAAGRFEKLAYDQSIEVDEKFLEALGLTDVLEGDKIYVGKAELSLLFSAARLFKASLEWVAAYDWNTDISFLKTDWNTLEDSFSSLAPKNLPFGNNFMKDRNNGMMAKSKGDFGKAIADTVAAYEHLISAASKLPPAYIEEMKEFLWLKDGLSKLDAAIQSGGNFYVPDSAPSGNSYDNSAANAQFGINLGKLFNPGQFAIDKMISAESGGNAPQFYIFEGETPQAVTSKAQWENLDGSYAGFQLNLSPIREVVVKGLEEVFADGENTIAMPLFPAQIGKELYGLYHK